MGFPTPQLKFPLPPPPQALLTFAMYFPTTRASYPLHVPCRLKIMILYEMLSPIDGSPCLICTGGNSCCSSYLLFLHIIISLCACIVCAHTLHQLGVQTRPSRTDLLRGSQHAHNDLAKTNNRERQKLSTVAATRSNQPSAEKPAASAEVPAGRWCSRRDTAVPQGPL